MVIFCKKMVGLDYLSLCVPVDKIVWYAGELGLDQDEQAPTEVKHVTRGAGRTLLFSEQGQNWSLSINNYKSDCKNKILVTLYINKFSGS